MAATTTHDVDQHLRDIISTLFVLIAQAHEYQGSTTRQAIDAEIQRLLKSLCELQKTAEHLHTRVPEEIINYVEDSRNPDIYTRELVELVMRYNQVLKGRSEAFASFRDILGEQMMVGIPEIKHNVQSIVEASGGQVE